eukprot:gb/GECH01002777.1/.p1 GENE.gb/GECH01002777.1/~~gb/GECH01002777.1/.p1  ORF type:complete len:594 (+),score=122.39 gb/GECH01002777.1/:1-1782(+)
MGRKPTGLIMSLPYFKHSLSQEDTADSQEPSTPPDSAPCTPTEIPPAFQTPKNCPPTPAKPSSSSKLRIKEATDVRASPVDLFGDSKSNSTTRSKPPRFLLSPRKRLENIEQRHQYVVNHSGASNSNWSDSDDSDDREEPLYKRSRFSGEDSPADRNQSPSWRNNTPPPQPCFQTPQSKQHSAPSLPFTSPASPSPTSKAQIIRRVSNSPPDDSFLNYNGSYSLSSQEGEKPIEGDFPPEYPQSPPPIKSPVRTRRPQGVQYNPFSPSSRIDEVPPSSFSDQDDEYEYDSRDNNMSPATSSRFITDFKERCPIGNGSFGTVFKCRKKIDDRIYAVKRNQRTIRGERDKEKILKEVKALATLVDNPHVVRYFNAWLENDILYVQTELCENGTVYERMKTRSFSDEELLDLLYQVVSGLEFMHSQNLVHLDIKPENIYINADDTYKIGDLGLIACASDVDKDVEEGDSRYLSLEMLQDTTTDMRKVDVFSLGISLFQLATGKELPRSGDEWQNLRRGEFTIQRQMDPELELLIRQMMHKDPDQRPSSSDILNHPLFSSRDAPSRMQQQIRNLQKKIQERDNRIQALELELEKKNK